MTGDLFNDVSPAAVIADIAAAIPVACRRHIVIIGSLAAVGDLRLILNRGVTGATRVARHLWRMTVAFFIAANSLFLGQQQVFPKAVRDSGLLNAPALLILGLLVYWLCHVGYGAYRRKRVRSVLAPSEISAGTVDLSP